MPDSKLVVKGHDQARTFLLSFEDGLVVAFVCYSPVAKEYADRLAACWNACESIPTEVLEESRPGNDLCAVMRQQRDEAHTALLALLTARALHGPYSEECHEATRTAMELLAKTGVNVPSERERRQSQPAQDGPEERQHKESGRA
jgi:hypothetical protein